jgi:hypothetical protein
MPYDRQLLLAGSKRNEVLEFWEVQRYGIESHGDADYVSIYGMPPAQWYSRGVRLLGRTAVECTRDDLGNVIGFDIAAVTSKASDVSETLVIDPFAGSGNTLYWLLRHLPGASGLGFELDPKVFELTRQNLALLALPIHVSNIDFESGLGEVHATNEQLVVAFVAPPWGDALSEISGLDLRRTQPPIAGIVDFLAERFNRSRLVCAIQLYENVEADSLAEVQRQFDWSDVRSYRLNAPGHNHGILIGTKGWTPGHGAMTSFRN